MHSLASTRRSRLAAFAFGVVLAGPAGLGACSPSDDAGAPGTTEETISITGTVVDATGAPVEDVSVATTWSAAGGEMSPMQDASTDAAGRFTLDVTAIYRGFDIGVFARSEDGTLSGAGLAATLGQEGHGEAAITLSPTIAWRAELAVPELDTDPEWLSATVSFPARHGGGAFLHLLAEDGRIGFEGPALDYGLLLHGPDLAFRSERIELDGTLPRVDGGRYELELSTVARLAGKPAPAWHVTAARNTGGNSQPTLADYRGKWILLEFWGYW